MGSSRRSGARGSRRVSSPFVGATSEEKLRGSTTALDPTCRYLVGTRRHNGDGLFLSEILPSADRGRCPPPEPRDGPGAVPAHVGQCLRLSPARLTVAADITRPGGLLIAFAGPVPYWRV